MFIEFISLELILFTFDHQINHIYETKLNYK